VSALFEGDVIGVINRRLLFDAGWIRLYERVIEIRGRAIKWVYCSRKGRRDLDAPDAVVVVPFVRTEDGTRLLVTKEFRAPIDGFEFGLPSGLIDSEELVEDAAARELEEETGYRVERYLERSPSRLVSSAGLTDETFQYQFVEAVKGSGQRLEFSEDIEVLLFSITELRELFSGLSNLSGRLWPLCHGYLSMGAFPI
jgi:8-oxo-dGTP pyrophosphatase MutT (NUDIX family)